MSDAGYHRYRAVSDGTSHGLVIERPQVLDGPSTPGDNDLIDRTVGDHALQRPHNLCRRCGALHKRGGQDHFHQRVAGAQNIQDVLPGRPCGGGHHADAPRPAREWALALRGKETLGAEPVP